MASDNLANALKRSVDNCSLPLIRHSMQIINHYTPNVIRKTDNKSIVSVSSGKLQNCC